ncbi:bacillithiol biosynthesis cysteine-adding enzyme BshC [Bacillus sp. FSL W7-1360]
MRIERLNKMHLQGLLYDYLEQPARCQKRFSYDIHDANWLRERGADISARSFPHRQALCDELEKKHAGLPHAEPCLNHIHKLRKDESLVVVGGQQTGILTGPLYTVYKAMSLIIMARHYEQTLQRPVVPVFWVAGEDHDLDEIRFVYMKATRGWQKHVLEDERTGESATDKAFPKAAFSVLSQKLFSSLPETMHTQHLQAFLLEAAQTSQTYSDFFQVMMHKLFAEEGLLYLDSGDQAIRQLERPFFRALIQQTEELQNMQQAGNEALTKLGYPSTLVTARENAHLFLTIDGTRRRLDYADGHFFIKGTNLSYTRETLLAMVEETPERFSNNVVTRPLMQEWLLPTLAFSAGPGELSYWATLKEVFTLYGLKIPPIVPRLSATIVPRHIEKWLLEQSESAAAYIAGEGIRKRESWLEKKQSLSIEDVVHEAQKEIEQAHRPLRQLARQMSPTLRELSEENHLKLQQQLQFLKEKMLQEVRGKHAVHLRKFDEAIDWLYPQSKPQERLLSMIIFVNLYGFNLFSRMIAETPPRFDQPFIYYL